MSPFTFFKTHEGEGFNPSVNFISFHFIHFAEIHTEKFFITSEKFITMICWHSSSTMGFFIVPVVSEHGPVPRSIQRKLFELSLMEYLSQHILVRLSHKVWSVFIA
jgi:hypothetical protein